MTKKKKAKISPIFVTKSLFTSLNTHNAQHTMYPYGGGYPPTTVYGGGYPGTTTTTTYVSIPQTYTYNPSMYYYEVPYDPFMPFIPPMGECLNSLIKIARYFKA